jgi:uncharacterized protein YecE (DUF72 family)
VRLGTSSWTFTGWGGLVYPGNPTDRELAASGLLHYARHPLFGTVGVDRSYYAPLSAADLERYAGQLPPGFPCVMKVWSGITTARDARTGERIDTFLDARAFDDRVLAPLRAAFRGHVGALVLELPPMRPCPTPAAFVERLDRFLEEAPRDFPLAVELRNRELLTPRYLDALARRGVGHVLNLWEAMPSIGEQLALPGVLTAPHVVCRLLLRPGTRYAQRKAELAPFDRIRDPNPEMRADVARLADLCGSLGKALFVLVNNKAEGSSPLTVRALAEILAATP